MAALRLLTYLTYGTFVVQGTLYRNYPTPCKNLSFAQHSPRRPHS